MPPVFVRKLRNVEEVAMRRFALVLMFGAAAGSTAVLVQAQSNMPLWAYGYNAPPPPPGTPPPAAPAAAASQTARPPEVARTLPGASGSFTRSQIFNIYGPVDWFPDA